MSIYGIGVDICEVARIKESLTKHSQAFVNKILHVNEQKIFQQHKLQAKYLAKRFAAKEAFAKALGTGIAEGVGFTEIEVINDKQGKPFLNLHGNTKLHLKTLAEKVNVHLSISDEKQYAVAQVIIEIF